MQRRWLRRNQWMVAAFRIGLPAGLTVILFVGLVVFYLLPVMEKTMMADRRKMIRELTATVLEMLTTYEGRVQTGELTAELARAWARDSLRQWRYGDERKEYFWIMEIRGDGRPYTIMQPFFPEHAGVDQYDLKDSQGVYFARDIVDVIRRHGKGFVQYDWQWKDDPHRVLPKLSYVQEFKPWRWIVGTGIYLDDMRAEIERITDTLKQVFSVVLLIITALSFFIIRQGVRVEKQRAMAEKARLESESRFRVLVENADDAIFFIDTQGCIRSANQAACRFLRMTHDQLTRMTLFELCGEHKGRLMRHIIGKLVAGLPYAVESELYRSDGVSYPVDVRLNLIDFRDERRILMVSRDMSDKKRAEQTLIASEKKYRTVVDSSLSGIYIVQDGVFVYVNPRFVRMHGYDRADEIIGRPIEDLIHPEYHNRVLQDWEMASGREQAKLFSTLKAMRRDGSELWVETLVTRTQYEGKEAFVGNAIDITDRKKMEERLRQAQKMEAIGTLAGGIAHDFNNILTAIIGYTYLANTELTPESKARVKLARVLAAGRRAQDLIRQILTFSRKAQSEQKSIYLHHLVKETVRLLRATIPATIKIRQRIDTRTDPVLVDPTQFHQVVMNLCTNAYHAMSERGGILEISLEQVRVSPEDAGRFIHLKAGGYVRLSVCDTGAGIEKAIINRIFEPYFTTKKKGEGTGMGLSVAIGIVESHGGRITVYSEPGKGSTFQVYLPVADEPAAGEPVVDTRLPTGDEHVLVVDDEADIASLLKLLLEPLGYRVTETTSSERALDLFAQDPHRYDAVITDMTMPDMTGKELAVRMLALRKDLPIIICTGFSDHINEAAAKAIGCRALIMKPVMVEALSRKLRQVLDTKPGY